MAQRAAAAEARADDLGKRAQTFEAKSKAQEREILQLISAKENAELRGGKPPPADAGPLSCSAVPATPRSSVLIYAALGLLALRRRSKD